MWSSACLMLVEPAGETIVLPLRSLIEPILDSTFETKRLAAHLEGHRRTRPGRERDRADDPHSAEREIVHGRAELDGWVERMAPANDRLSLAELDTITAPS